MLEIAATSAREAGLSNVGTQVMDAQDLKLPADSFDAAISRNALMLVPDIHTALSEMRRVLRSGGRTAAIVFSTPEKVSLPVDSSHDRPACWSPDVAASGAVW